MSRTLGIVLFPRFQILDATGPIAAFEVGGRIAQKPYEIRLFAHEPGLVRSTSGVSLPAEGFEAARGVDTLIVVGGDIDLSGRFDYERNGGWRLRNC